MQLTFRDVEKAFEIEEKTLYQWLNSRGMPAVKANDQYYFNSVEILEWALKNRIRLTTGRIKALRKSPSGPGRHYSGAHAGRRVFWFEWELTGRNFRESHRPFTFT